MIKPPTREIRAPVSTAPSATASPSPDYAEHPGPLIWADDDEVHGETVAEAVSEPVLLLAPTSALGLTPAHLEQARVFLAGLPRMEGA